MGLVLVSYDLKIIEDIRKILREFELMLIKIDINLT